ncbi:MAG TPA: O-methyltransferase [Nocardioidaceae bacterium]|nr:O-methyltransferase [Nocardioidaceae bacterium]
MRRITELGGRRAPFLRWSALRMVFGGRSLLKNWQVGDGREQALFEYVEKHASRGDATDVVRVIDEFCYRQSIMMNVGDEKGELLDAALRKVDAGLVLELGTYCGYSATRMASVAPKARIVSVEFSADNAAIARRMFDHAGVGDRVSVVVGHLGDGGTTADRLETEQGFGPGSVDFAFVDHAKDAYLPDLQLILDRGWLHPGSVVVADNVKLPGAPKYRAFMQEHEGKDWRTVEHATHVEYQTLLKDLVLESTYNP